MHVFIYINTKGRQIFPGKMHISSNSTFFFFNSLVSGIFSPSTHSHFQNLKFNHWLCNSVTMMETTGCCFIFHLYSLYSLYLFFLYLLCLGLLDFFVQSREWFWERVGVIFHWLFLNERVSIISAALSCPETEVCCSSLFICHPKVPFSTQQLVAHVLFQ